jgi:hypothetical protein
MRKAGIGMMMCAWIGAAACGQSDAAPTGGDAGGRDAHVDEGDAGRTGPDAARPDAGEPADAGGQTDGGTRSDGGSDGEPDGGGTPIVPEDWCQTGDSVLARTVQGMEAGTWAELPQNDSLAGLELEPHLTSWSDTGVYNPVDRTVQWVGSPGSCCADPATFVLLRYDVASDTWSKHSTPWNDHSGHAYDASAMDPETGTHYFARAGSVAGWDGEQWRSLPSPAVDDVIAPALDWLPDRDGTDGALLYISGNTRMARYDGSEWTRVDTGDIDGWGNYTMFAEYNPVHEVLWLGSGNGGERIHYRMNHQYEFTRLEDAPFDLLADGGSIKTYDPRSGTFIVLNKGGDQPRTWWTYGVMQDTWTNVTDAIDADLPETWADDHRMFVVPIDDCGVLMYFSRRFDSRHVYLYKHSG